MGKSKELNLSNSIYDKLRELIIYGELNPGEKIEESKITADFRASRTPFREAIKRLEAKGYVETIHNRGAYVRRITTQEVENSLDVLSVLEGFAAYHAARNIKDQEIEALEKIKEDLEELNKQGEYRKYHEKNVELHFMISKFSGNDFLHDLIQEIWDRIYKYRFIGLMMVNQIKNYLSEHQAIIEAIKERNPEKAEEKMRQHINRTKDVIVGVLKEFQIGNFPLMNLRLENKK
jgi:DNA-binding GntR family transcriptional regulator